MKLTNISSKIKEAVKVFRPSQNELCSANKGLSAFLYGKDLGSAQRLGLIHIITASRFQKEINLAAELAGNCSEAAIKKSIGIKDSIPKAYENAFYEVKYLEDFVNSEPINMLASFASKVRKGYDMAIDKPIAKIRSGFYFGYHKLKDSITGVFKKHRTDIDLDFAKKVLHPKLRIPENLTPEELKEFVMTELRKCYSEAEIQSILDRKSPIFYRFVDETELRALKNGHAISSSAEYNLDYCRTDITSDPNYNFNKYRITFKKDNPNWNPYAEGGSLVSLHDPRSKKWWLFGAYDKADILCTERVRQ